MILPRELIVFLVGAIPELEMGGSIPLGKALHMSVYSAFFWSLLSITLGTIIVFRLLDQIIIFLFKHFPKLHKLVDHHFKKIHTRHNKNFQRWGLGFLIILRILPIPGTGSYTMVALAYLLELPYWPSILAIFISNLIYGLILSQIIIGAITFIHF